MTNQQDRLVGFGFRPTEEELINHYLARRVEGIQSGPCIIPDVDIYEYDPWLLPDVFHDKSIIDRDEQVQKWWFFSQHMPSRSRRWTCSGYWKKTCKDKQVKTEGTGMVIGIKEYLVFYEGRGKKASKTNWIIHSYRLPTDLTGTHVLCCLKNKRDKKADNLTEEQRQAVDWANSIILDEPVQD